MFCQSKLGELDFRSIARITFDDFFKEGGASEVLRESIFPEMLKNASPELPLRIWVPACGTGEEVYALAICLLEFLNHANTCKPFRIFGTDTSKWIIQKAAAGVYLKETLQGVPAKYVRPFFRPVNDQYQVEKLIRGLCTFSILDHGRSVPCMQLDLVSCCSLLASHGAVVPKSVVFDLACALKPGAHLFMVPAAQFVPRARQNSTAKNKELRAIYQQMEATRQELQSVNEELTVANEELSRTGISVHLESPPGAERQAPEVEAALIRVAQESLTNIHRHSGSKTAQIRISIACGEIQLEVQDWGHGIPRQVLDSTAPAPAGLGVGIAGMRERVHKLGGRVEIHSGAEGTLVRAILPLRQRESSLTASASQPVT